MSLPLGYAATSTTEVVCKLKNSLYGLKQSPRAWFGRFTKSMCHFGYKHSNSNHTVFLKHQKGKVIIYMDDMVITGDDILEIGRLQQ